MKTTIHILLMAMLLSVATEAAAEAEQPLLQRVRGRVSARAARAAEGLRAAPGKVAQGVAGLWGLRKPKALKQAWAKDRALAKVERQVRDNPRLQKALNRQYGKIARGALLSVRGAWLMLGIGAIVNVGGFVQPEKLMPYLAAGVAVDATSFISRVVSIRRARRKTTLAMIADGEVPQKILKPHTEALGLKGDAK